MSSRPRFAGDGAVRLPEWTEPRPSRGIPTGIGGTFGEEVIDPFERGVESGLLLAEEFARLELGDVPELAAWSDRHGVVDLVHALPSETRRREMPVADTFHDDIADIAVQQRNVAWHLEAIAHLSDHLVPQPGMDAGVEWDPAWSQPVLAIGDAYHWRVLDGLARQLLPAMRDSAEPGPLPAYWPDEEEWQAWWAAGHAAWRTIEERRVPIVRAVSVVGGSPEHIQRATLELVAGELTDDLGDGPWDLIELERRLMTPYLVVAGEHQVRVGWLDPEEWPGDGRPPLDIREQRTWDSILAPIYLQLFEGLRRVSERQRGGAFCKECGRPFLTLDARRSAFCSDRDRLRFGQREHRRRRREAAQGVEP